MTTDELNAIVQAVMQEMEKAGVDFDFKAETPQADDLVYVMRGTADKYQGITVKWQNLLDIIVRKATEARDDAISAKDIALQTLATIQGIESNVSTMKSSVDESEANVASMKASVETSEANVTQMKSDVSEMKTSVEGTKTEVEGLKAQTQTIVDNAKEEVTGLLDTKVDKSSVLTYDNIIASTPPMDLDSAVPSASALKHLKPITISKSHSNNPSTSYVEQTGCRITIPANSIYGIFAERGYSYANPQAIFLSVYPPSDPNHEKYPIAYGVNDGTLNRVMTSATLFATVDTTIYVYAKDSADSTTGTNTTKLNAWYITF